MASPERSRSERDAPDPGRVSGVELLDLTEEGPAEPTPVVLALTVLPPLAAAVATLLWSDPLGGWTGVLWVAAFVPLLLLARRSGWRGAAIAIAAGMVVFVAVEVLARVVPEFEALTWFFLLVAAVLVTAALGTGWLARRIVAVRRETLDRALRVALEDPEAGLPTRRATELFFRKVFAGAQRGAELSLVLFDLDGFQQFVESYGRETAARLLSDVGAVFRETSRAADLVGRWGSQEFLAVLPHEGSEGAGTFAERVRQKADRLEFRWEDGSVASSGLTVSAGVASFEEGMEEPSDLLERSHRALHAAKAKGGDSVVLFDHEAHGTEDAGATS